MTDQQPTSDEQPDEIPVPQEWHPSDSPTLGQPGSLAVPEFVPTSFEEARARMKEVGEAELKGSLFPVVDKEVLLKMPFIILDWQWNTDPNTKTEYVSLHVIAQDNQRWCVNDGGTGIYRQIKQWEHDQPERKTMIDIPNGLRKSEYIAKYKGVDKDTGEIVDMQSPATTYYIA